MVSLRALVFAAFARPDRDLDEARLWRDAYALDGELSIPGVPEPLRYTDDGLGLAVTGIGKADAAATVTALLGSSDLDLRDAYVVTAGIAGAPPDAGTLGAVFLADGIVDWDRKYRWHHGDEAGIDLLGFRDRDYVYDLDPDLVGAARRIAAGVDLVDTGAARAYRERYPHEAARSAPFVARGTTVCGEEFWHGRDLAEQASWLADRYGAGEYVTTQAEDFGVALALDRFGRLDRYLSVRAVSNFDRPHPGQGVRESLDATRVGYEPALRNAFRVGSAVVDRVVARWDDWRDGVPGDSGGG